MAENRHKKAEYNGHIVEFWDQYEILPNEYKEHVYVVDGFEKPSVTQVLQQQGLAEEYPEDNEYVIKAREKGTFIHEDCENVIKNPNYRPLTPEARYVKEVILKQFINFNAEVILYTDYYAGQTDLICETKDKKYNVIIDYKTGAWDRETVQWQTTMYKYGLIHCNIFNPEKPTLHYVAELRGKKEDCKLVLLEEIPYPEYKRLCDCLVAKKTFEKSSLALTVANLVTEEQLEAIDRFFDVWERIPQTLQYSIWKKMDTPGKNLEKAIKAELLANNQKRGRTPDGCLWEISMQDRNTFDTKRFESEHPKLHAKYMVSKPTAVLRFKENPYFTKKKSKKGKNNG